MHEMQNMLNEADDVSQGRCERVTSTIIGAHRDFLLMQWCSCTPHKLLYARMYSVRSTVRYLASARKTPLQHSADREARSGTPAHRVDCVHFILMFLHLNLNVVCPLGSGTLRGLALDSSPANGRKPHQTSLDQRREP